MTEPRPVSDRFWGNVYPGQADDCWEWHGTLRADGYGQIRIGASNVLAHRLAWQLAVGPIPDDLCVLHRCDNPPCVNPDHLWLGTHADNMHDMFAKGRERIVLRERTHCKHGHAYTPSNTGYGRNGKGLVTRRCRQCHSLVENQRRAARKAAA